MKKIPISTNQENPRYFILWYESQRGTIRKFVRVYEHQENMNSLLAALAQDPRVSMLKFGEGVPNRKRTTMKVESISTYQMAEIEELEDDSLQESDV